jgi:hypothetical protein
VLLPFLRVWNPEPVYMDLVHMEEMYWRNGGFARYSAGPLSLSLHC